MRCKQESKSKQWMFFPKSHQVNMKRGNVILILYFTMDIFLGSIELNRDSLRDDNFDMFSVFSSRNQQDLSNWVSPPDGVNKWTFCGSALSAEERVG